MAQRPVAIGLLLCEQLIIEENTRYVTPVNCFSTRYVEDVPTEPISFVVLAYLTDGSGDITMKVVVERLDSLEALGFREQAVRFASPLHEIRCTFRFRNWSFPVEGAYQVQLLADGEIVAQKKFLVRRREPPL